MFFNPFLNVVDNFGWKAFVEYYYYLMGYIYITTDAQVNGISPVQIQKSDPY